MLGPDGILVHAVSKEAIMRAVNSRRCTIFLLSISSHPGGDLLAARVISYQAKAALLLWVINCPVAFYCMRYLRGIIGTLTTG